MDEIGDHGPIDPALADSMNDLAVALDALFNPHSENRKIGFVLLAFPIGGGPGRPVNYISNTGRADLLVAVRAWLERADPL